VSALEEYRALPVGAPRSLTKVKADAAIAELEEEARHHNWVESQVARKATKRAEKAESDVKWLKEKVRLTEAQFVQRTQMWERAETENTRLMRLLDKPFLEKLAELEAEIARLRVCGNCGNVDSTINELPRCNARRKGESYRDVWYSDPCHFTPSRWTPYWEEP